MSTDSNAWPICTIISHPLSSQYCLRGWTSVSSVQSNDESFTCFASLVSQNKLQGAKSRSSRLVVKLVVSLLLVFVAQVDRRGVVEAAACTCSITENVDCVGMVNLCVFGGGCFCEDKESVNWAKINQNQSRFTRKCETCLDSLTKCSISGHHDLE